MIDRTIDYILHQLSTAPASIVFALNAELRRVLAAVLSAARRLARSAQSFAYYGLRVTKLVTDDEPLA